jgi:hypothetical protein
MKAIVVGSHSEQHWFGKLSVQLAQMGVQIVGHWPDLKSAKSKRGIDEAERILVTKDCCSHSLVEMAKLQCGPVPITYISHRKADNVSTLGRWMRA